MNDKHHDTCKKRKETKRKKIRPGFDFSLSALYNYVEFVGRPLVRSGFSELLHWEDHPKGTGVVLSDSRISMELDALACSDPWMDL